MISVIFEDEYCLCVSKPNDVVVHHAHHSRNVADEDSLLQLLHQQFGKKFYPIHRLDRRTSGIILLAKETQYVSKFQELFVTDKIQKIYLGVVRGFSPDTKVIDSPVKGRDAKVYKEAETHLKCLNKITLDIPVKPYDTSRYSLVELTPKTGRLHQLRIHMQQEGHFIVGDKMYADGKKTIFGKGLMLCARSISFQHPATKETINLQIKYPKKFRHILDREKKLFKKRR